MSNSKISQENKLLNNESDEFNISNNELSEVIVLVMDLLNPDALSMAAQMSLELHEVAEGLRVAQEIEMRLLLVAIERHERKVSCVPVTEFVHLPKAIHALCDLISAQSRPVSWIMVPENMSGIITPHIDNMRRIWEERTQGTIA